jgi:hypothetical protein
MSTTLSILLELHAASSALQRAHATAVNNGRPDLAAAIHAAGERVATAVGTLVVEESKKRRPMLEVVP